MEDFVGPVNGLVDNRRAAALLGVPVNTFKVWASRAKTARTGITAHMPTPVASMHGHIYRVEDIEEFGRKIALSARAPRTTQRNLGAYFTPDDASSVMVRWAIRSGDVVLEPSVGEGQFAIAAQQHAASRGWDRLDLYACELDPETAARAVGRGAVAPDRMYVGDFMDARHLPMVDAVVGNPPYVRVRELPGTLRRNALRAAESTMGIPMDSAGSAWVPFVAKSTTHLRAGGRLALVLPLDFTYVRYARPLWEFLGRSFGSLQVLRFRERVFGDISQNVLVLLAGDRGGTTGEIEVYAHDRLADMPTDSLGDGVSIHLEDVVAGQRVFQRALLPEVTRGALLQLANYTGPAGARAKFNIGYVSGNKKFFHPEPDDIRAFKLPKKSLRSAIVTSRQISRAGLGTSTMSQEGVLWLPGERLTEGEKAYVAAGERDGIDMAYKCRIRKHWYRVPGVKVPDLLLTTFSDRPRLHLNDAGWVASNSVLGGFMREGEAPADFVSSWYTPFTLLSTELEVHSLGGGVMIAVPREADSVRILNRDVTLQADRDDLDAALKSGDVEAAYSVGAESIRQLVGQECLDALWRGSEVLMRWRKAQAEHGGLSPK